MSRWRSSCRERGRRWQRVKLDELVVTSDGRALRFARRLSLPERIAKWGHRLVARAQGIVRRFIFLTFFALAYALSWVFGWLFDLAFAVFPPFAPWFVEHATGTMVVVVTVEVAILLHLMARRVPAWIDNGYRHETGR